jgi:hypothetical protein
MTTIVVHGTMANGASWYQGSWEGDGFLAALCGGMVEASDWHDAWMINGEPVWSYSDLSGVYEWNGLAEGIYRGIAAQQLAAYLNIVADLTDEPIRIIAHSHGCNVVKLASSLPSLSPNVFIEQAVFLACPHFYEDSYEQEELSGLDKFDIRKVAKAYKKSGHRFRYKLNPQRFKRVLNLYCEKDKVQVDLAQSLAGGQVPLTGSILENIKKQMFEGILELPIASRWDIDKDASHLYQNQEIQVEHKCSGTKTHSVMHGSFIGALAGYWLNSHKHIQDVLECIDLPVLPCDDTGG